jgi:RNA polymerase sigma-70 factor (ECF subfamily)
LAAGRTDRFALLVERYSSDLFQFVARFFRNPAMAEDVVQETFIQVYQSAAGFDSSRKFRPWLFTIAANKARDHIRGKTRRREVSISGGGSTESSEVSYLDFLADETASPGEAMEASEQERIVRDVVNEMPAHLREVLVLGYYQRFAYKEIAEMLDIPLGTVKSRLHAAVANFAAAYKRLEKETNVGDA